MRKVSARLSRGVTLAALLIVITLGARGDEPPSPFDPPDARIHPPIGIASNARIHPPIGASSKPSFFKLMLEWFLARIDPID